MAITTDDFNKIWASTSPLTPYSFSASQYKEGWNFIGGTPPSRQMWDFLQKNNDEKMQYLLNNFDNYLPLSGGTLTGFVNGVTPPNGDNSKKLATTAFVNAKAQEAKDTAQEAKDIAQEAKAVADDVVTGWDTKANVASPAFTGTPTAPTPTAGDNSTKIATTAFVNAKAAKYLPLSGGTMSGWLSANENEFRIRNSKAEHDGAVSVFGGEAATTGANLYLYGTSHSSQAGSFVLSATDGANPKSLRGQADGTLTWNNKEIATTEFVNAKAGNYLPLSGGTLTGVVNGVTPPNGDNSTKLATTEFVNAKAGGGTPTGVVQAFAGRTTPQGWLLCDGSAVSRTTYANLYACIGTTYGAGDGSTTFNLPNLVDKFVEGSATAGTVKSAGLPNITGYLLAYSWNDGVSSGAFSHYADARNKQMESGDSIGYVRYDFDASRSSAIYGKSDTVQPPALTMRYIIKY